MSITKFCSPSALNTELEGIRSKVSLQETEDSWDTIEQGIIQLTECCNNGGCVFATEMVATIRSLSRPLNGAINSERSRLSGSTLKLITALSTGLGRAFESLLSIFLPTLLGLCARANKLFVTRAKACIITVVEHTRSPSILPYLAESVDHKSPSLRLAAAEGILACLENFSPSDSARSRRFEDVIKLTTRDASADVRATGKKICAAYNAILPETMASAPVTSIVQKAVILPPRQGAIRVPSSAPVTSIVQKTGTVGHPPLRGASRVPKSAPVISVIQKTGTVRHPSLQSASCVPSSAPVTDVVQKIGIVGHPSLQSASRILSSAPVADVVQKIGTLRTVGPSSRQGAIRVPLASSLGHIQRANQLRDAPRPLISTTSRPQQMPVRQEKGCRVWDGPLRIPISQARLPETKNVEKTRIVHPLSVKPSSFQKSLVPRYDRKNNIIATKIHSTSSKHCAVTQPLSQDELRPFKTAVHPATRGANSRVGRSRPRESPSKKVEPPKMLSQPSGRVISFAGRPVATGPRRVLKAPPRHPDLCGTKNRDVHKLLPGDKRSSPERPTAVPPSSMVILSRRVESVASVQPLVPASVHYALPVPEGAIRPLRTEYRTRKSPFRSRRHNNPSTQTPSKAFNVSSPSRRSPSSPLSPYIYGTEITPHVHALRNPMAQCFQGRELQRVLKRLNSQRVTPMSHIKTPQGDFLTSTPREPLLAPVSPPRFHGVKPIAHARTPGRLEAHISGLRVARRVRKVRRC